MTTQTQDHAASENDAISSDPDEQPNDTQPAVGTPEPEKPETDEAGEFNLSEFEDSFGLPAGALSELGAEDEASAYDALKTYVGKTMTLGQTAIQTQAPPEEPATEPKPDQGKSGTPEDSEIVKMRKELEDVKSQLAQQQRGSINEKMTQLDARMEAEIDSWASPKYGTSKSRNYKQQQAVKELLDLVHPHVVGVATIGKPVPVIEKVLRSVRPFHDDEFDPGKAKSSNTNADALGTPGAGSTNKGEDGPRNIHEFFGGRYK